MKRYYKKALFFIALLASLIIKPVFANGNPYGGGWSNCTWSAWQLAAQNGTYLPNLGNAGNWINAANNAGLSTGNYPSANSIAVYSNHVVYVAGYDGGDTMYIQEGGFNGGYHEDYASAYGGRHGQALLGFIYLTGNSWEPVYEDVVEEIPTQATQTASSSTMNTTNISSSNEPIIEEITQVDLVEIIPGVSVHMSNKYDHLEELKEVIEATNKEEEAKERNSGKTLTFSISTKQLELLSLAESEE